MKSWLLESLVGTLIPIVANDKNINIDEVRISIPWCDEGLRRTKYSGVMISNDKWHEYKTIVVNIVGKTNNKMLRVQYRQIKSYVEYRLILVPNNMWEMIVEITHNFSPHQQVFHRYRTDSRGFSIGWPNPVSWEIIANSGTAECGDRGRTAILQE